MPPEQAAEVLKNVVNSQRKILGEVFEGKDITEIPQVWCLYKEVMGYYDDYGLTVPDDVTLLWVDDNWGNVRRLPLASETNRSGGAGGLKIILFCLKVYANAKNRGILPCGLRRRPTELVRYILYIL